MGHDLKRVLAILSLTALAACSSGDPQSAANDVTRAVYQDDVSGVVSHVDEGLVSEISRASVGVISDKMHALGAYNGLTAIASDPAKREYTYRANFARGTMNVIIRTDPDGKLAAYRVYPTI
jgi:hypothetical protein